MIMIVFAKADNDDEQKIKKTPTAGARNVSVGINAPALDMPIALATQRVIIIIAAGPNKTINGP